ncbi:MAG: (d)CMP kinase [Trichlorobacter sp.]|nr:(d)CMP kinase [Trichlorobacter sp.]
MSRENGIIIAVDGPSGAGKSTLSKLLSKRLGYLEIDTGAMYRAMAWLARNRCLDLLNQGALADFCNNALVELQLRNGNTLVFANGQDVTGEIRTPEISMLTSKISALAPVRRAMIDLQRRMGARGGVILDGRDIGTVVFPDAELKFFLSASAAERGRRRFLELQAKGEQVSLEETVKNIIERDQQDTERELSPLKQAEDAISIDSTDLSIDEMVNLMEEIFLKRISEGN